MENGEILHVFRDGSWEYSFSGIRILYCKEKKQYAYSITGTEESIISVNQCEIMRQAKKKISELWEICKIVVLFFNLLRRQMLGV